MYSTEYSDINTVILSNAWFPALRFRSYVSVSVTVSITSVRTAVSSALAVSVPFTERERKK